MEQRIGVIILVHLEKAEVFILISMPVRNLLQMEVTDILPDLRQDH